jgi:hypothetical protein
MLKGLSTGLKTWLAFQFVLAVFFFAFGWSQTSSLMFGRNPAFADVVALASPLVLVIACALLAASAARRGRPDLAQISSLVPIPAAILLAMIAGVV